MSTPTVERTRERTRQRPSRGSAQGPTQSASRGAGSAVSSPRDPGGAVGRAYAKRAGRRQRLGGSGIEETEGRSRFVLMIMVMLGVGLVASLWLSTTAAADSYRLNAARQSTRDLTERIEIAQSQIDAMQSPPAIARAAASLGMVQVTDVPRLIVGPDGHVTVFGTPKVAVAAAPPAPVLPAGPALPAVPGAALAASSPDDRMTPEQLVAAQAQQAPQAQVPQAQQAQVPQTQVPQTQAPQTQAPQTQQPQTQAGSTTPAAGQPLPAGQTVETVAPTAPSSDRTGPAERQPARNAAGLGR